MDDEYLKLPEERYSLASHINVYFLFITLFKYRWFDRFILMIIALNAVSLALFDYTDKDMNGPLNKKLDLCNRIFTLIFIIEAALKILAMGFIFHAGAYMRDYWNVMDILIVITG